MSNGILFAGTNGSVCQCSTENKEHVVKYIDVGYRIVPDLINRFASDRLVLPYVYTGKNIDARLADFFRPISGGHAIQNFQGHGGDLGTVWAG